MSVVLAVWREARHRDRRRAPSRSVPVAGGPYAQGTTSILRVAAVVAVAVAVTAASPALGAMGARSGEGTPGPVAGKVTPKMDGHWVNTWVSMPQLTEPGNMPPAPFTQDDLVLADSTLRQTVRTSVGGRQMRLRFSNAFGGTALPITRVSVALPAGGQAGVSAIKAGTSRPVTFHGKPSVVIPVGAQAVSDPLNFELAPGSNLTVTIYLAEGQKSVDITSHPGSRTTSYMVAGDHVDAEDLPGATSTAHWYFLSGLETWSKRTTAGVAIVGDSLTDGRGSTTNGNDRWPDRLLDRLQAHPGTGDIAILNQAAGGNRVLNDGLGPNALARLDRDVFAQSGVKWQIVFEGVNDLGTAEATEAAQKQVAADLIAAYDQMIIRAHAHGIRVYGATLTPFGANEMYDDAQGYREAARQTVNQWIRTSRRFDAVIDFDRAARDPADLRRLLPAYDGGDHLHLNPAGYKALADAVPARLFRDEPLPRGFGFD
ncbi:SGNH/GDSL hydrolase family protein [Streptosporangium lutulentum]|uniref:Lysophospholipase L1-like esterase n=1 Tax=Streptosporangium lutulentum TaxID=1461250 RepID=A0ABT9Q7M2_9ACTN|nr:SGNH/GDSL hydrolase family protein [Streptosporangium lutulentum]MDP9842744.1 lysophospholipase L1-like esterase [Streptosporangium lutulentum]